MHIVKIVLSSIIALLILSGCGEKKVSYYDSGNIKSIYNYNYDGERDGVQQEFFDQHDALRTKMHYKNGVLHGQMISYLFRDGGHSIANYKNGKRDGEYISYDENQNIRYKEYYKKGKRHGEYIRYFKNGEIKEYCEYNMGKKHGDEKRYYKNGNLKAYNQYKDGKNHGSQKYYYENGQLKEEVEENYGAFVKRTFYRKDGRKSRVMHYNERNQLHGKYIKYSPYGGSGSTTIMYKNGRKVKN